MNSGPLLYFGLVTTLVVSWFGFVAVPHRQLGALRPDLSTNAAGTAVSYPAARSGEAAQGREIYHSLGCAACHTQQVRPAKGGSDLARGWGRRRTVARDYIQDPAVLLGDSRLGPDLANYGERLGTNSFPLIRLFNPGLVATNTVCPALPFLFEKRAIRRAGPSAEALGLPAAVAPGAGWEIVPTLRAYQLAAYLRSLSTSTDLPEAPLPPAEDANAPK
jgi:cytochrome c oxidase cbb3-type subunit II